MSCRRDLNDFGHLQSSIVWVEGAIIAKCANPACRTSFDHLIGGRFFRFRLAEAEVPVIPGATQNAHHIIHYWLCPVCSKRFALIHVGTGKVALRLLEEEFEVAPPQDQLTAA